MLKNVLSLPLKILMALWLLNRVKPVKKSPFVVYDAMDYVANNMIIVDAIRLGMLNTLEPTNWLERWMLREVESYFAKVEAEYNYVKRMQQLVGGSITVGFIEYE
jgi:hypothetical protein